MERLNRALAGAGLALTLMLALTSAGCRSLRPEVPPGRPFTPDGQQTPPIGFSSTPGTPTLNGLPNNPGLSPSNSSGQVGVPIPNANPYGTPSSHSFGPPGSSGLGVSPSVGAATGAGMMPATPPGGSDPSTGIPQTGTGPGR
jgi:hypothetical protein